MPHPAYDEAGCPMSAFPGLFNEAVRVRVVCKLMFFRSPVLDPTRGAGCVCSIC